jgi:CRISPR-associated protein Csb3
MSSSAVQTIRFPVDPANPGQFFASCGLLELADRLWPGSEGWFDEGMFKIEAGSTDASLHKLLEAAKIIHLLDNDNDTDHDQDEKDEGQETEDTDDVAAPLHICSPISLRMDWWSDKSLKPWAGSMNARRIFLAMCNAIDPDNADPFNQGLVVFDDDRSDGNVAPHKRKGKPKKREPFYFDSRRGANALSIDIGFAPDSLKLTTVAYPVVEAMCLVGLQRCRPRPTDIPRVFDYFTWHMPLPITVTPLAVSGMAGQGNGFRFENAFRTNQRKHKAFNPSTLLQRI